MPIAILFTQTLKGLRDPSSNETDGGNIQYPNKVRLNVRLLNKKLETLMFGSQMHIFNFLNIYLYTPWVLYMCGHFILLCFFRNSMCLWICLKNKHYHHTNSCHLWDCLFVQVPLRVSPHTRLNLIIIKIWNVLLFIFLWFCIFFCILNMKKIFSEKLRILTSTA